MSFRMLRPSDVNAQVEVSEGDTAICRVLVTFMLTIL